jgi:hypothetical protein
MPPVTLWCTVTGVPGAARVAAPNVSPELCVVVVNAASVAPVAVPTSTPTASIRAAAARTRGRRVTPGSAAGARSG